MVAGRSGPRGYAILSSAKPSIRIALGLLLIGFVAGLWFSWRGSGPEATSLRQRTEGPTTDTAAPSDSTGLPDWRPVVAGDTDHPGREVYMVHCASCHGSRGEGQPDWKIANEDGSLPAPPHDSTGHTWHHTDAELLRIITEGGVIYMPESNMPGYADILEDEEVHAVLGYIKTLWGPREAAFQNDVTRDWEAATASEEQR